MQMAEQNKPVTLGHLEGGLQQRPVGPLGHSRDPDEDEERVALWRVSGHLLLEHKAASFTDKHLRKRQGISIIVRGKG